MTSTASDAVPPRRALQLPRAETTESVDPRTGESLVTLKLPVTAHDGELPLVSILTPTYGRPHFHALAQYVVQHVDYPADHLEWIVVDDSPPGQGWDSQPAFKKFRESWGAAPGLGLSPSPGTRLRYVRVEGQPKMALGKKRNFLAALARADVLVHLDDDDYYPPETLLARVKTLMKYETGCVASTRVPCYDLAQQTAFEAFDPAEDDPTAPTSVSEATLCYTKAFWRARGFAEAATEGEGRAFVADRPEGAVVDVPGTFVIRALSHLHNTVRGRWVNPDGADMVTATRRGREVFAALPGPVQQILTAVRRNYEKTDGPVLRMHEYLMRLQHQYKGNRRKLAKVLDRDDPTFRSHPVVAQFRNGLTRRHLPPGVGPGRGPRREVVWYVDARGASHAGSGGVPTGEFTVPADAAADVGAMWTATAGEAAATTVRVAEALAEAPGLAVTVYVPGYFKGAGHLAQERRVRGVVYRPWYLWNPHDEHDVWVAWKYADVIDVLVGDAHGGRYWDAVDEVSPAQLTSARVQRLRGMLWRGQWQRSLYEDLPTSVFGPGPVPLGLRFPPGGVAPEETPGRWVVCLDDGPNGVETVLKLWPQVHPPAVGDPVRLIWRGCLPPPTREGGASYASWASTFQQQWKDLVTAGEAEAGTPVLLREPADVQAWAAFCAQHQPVVVSATTRVATSPLTSGAVYAVALAAGARVVLPQVGVAADLAHVLAGPATEGPLTVIEVDEDPTFTARDIHRGLVSPDVQDRWVAAVQAAVAAGPVPPDTIAAIRTRLQTMHGSAAVRLWFEGCLQA